MLMRMLFQDIYTCTLKLLRPGTILYLVFHKLFQAVAFSPDEYRDCKSLPGAVVMERRCMMWFLRISFGYLAVAVLLSLITGVPM